MSRRTRVLAWLLLTACAAAALAMAMGPAWYIQPFSPQTATGLERALAMREHAPSGTLVALAACLLFAATLWRDARPRWHRAGLVVVPLLALGATCLARFNHFEAMFAPLPAPQFAAARDVDFVGDEDMVLAVESQGDAVAFPVLQLANHHIVQEEVGGVPIVATY